MLTGAWGYRHRWCLRVVGAVALLHASCTQEVVAPASSPGGAEVSAALRYTVYLDTMPADTVHVELAIGWWEHGDSIRLILPPLYADNPLPTPRGLNVHNVALRDSSGASIPFVVDSQQFGLYRNGVLRAPLGASVTLEYDVTFAYEAPSDVPLPFVGEQRGYLQGTYLFAVPYEGAGGLARVWRRAWDINLDYVVADAMRWWGDPLVGKGVRNAYELLFSTSGLGGEVLIERSVAGQAFRFVNLRDTIYSDSMLEAVEEGFAAIMTDVTELFGTLDDHPLTVAMGLKRGGGLEGMYAFTLLNPFNEDRDGLFHVVAAHEAIHCWVGVRVGEYDDPWWKEATTNYLGFVVAARNGLCSRRLLEKTMLADLGDSTDVREYALSDPLVRSRLFAAEGDMLDLVYEKGAQVCMLMERRIGEATGWAIGFDQLIAELAHDYDGAAFSRQAYLAYVSARTGVDLGPLFARYVDCAGAIPVSVLSTELQTLFEAGVFEGAFSLANMNAALPAKVVASTW